MPKQLLTEDRVNLQHIAVNGETIFVFFLFFFSLRKRQEGGQLYDCVLANYPEITKNLRANQLRHLKTMFHVRHTQVWEVSHTQKTAVYDFPAFRKMEQANGILK